MKTMRLFLLASLSAATLTACGEAKKENTDEGAGMPMQNEMHSEMDHDAAHAGEAMDSTATVEFKDEKVAQVYAHYNHIRTALVDSDAEEAKHGADMLVKALQDEKNEAALTAAQTIAGTTAIEAQRTAFSDLSAAVEKMVAGSVKSGAIYKQYCPMAFQGEGGFWLSSTEQILNPYFGDKMLKCGSVRDTIK